MLQTNLQDKDTAAECFHSTVKRLQRRKQAKQEPKQGLPKASELTITQVPTRRKSLKKIKLSSDVVEAIWEAVRKDMLTYEQAADRFQITARLVCKLVKQIKAEPDFVNELRDRERERKTKLQLTSDVIVS